MAVRLRAPIMVPLLAALLLSAGCYPNPQPPGLTPVPTLPAGMTPTPAPQIQTPLGQTPTLFVPQSMGELVPFAPEIQTVPPPASPAPTGAPAPVPVAANQVSAAVGAPLYMESCLCHGNQGQGVSAPPLRNSQFIQVAGDQAVDTVIAFGRNNTRMPAWLLGQCGPLTDAQIKSVVAYLHALQGVPPVPTATLGPPTASPAPGSPQPSQPPTTAPTSTAAPQLPSPATPGGTAPAVNLSGDVGRGRVEFGPNCASCHGPEGLQGIPNPGANSGTVPVLSPIHPTIANPDPRVFAARMDVFIQHGSIPAGPSPEILMPAFGDRNLLTQQQIADLIAYVIRLNTVCPGLSCS